MIRGGLCFTNQAVFRARRTVRYFGRGSDEMFKIQISRIRLIQIRSTDDETGHSYIRSMRTRRRSFNANIHGCKFATLGIRIVDFVDLSCPKLLAKTPVPRKLQCGHEKWFTKLFLRCHETLVRSHTVFSIFRISSRLVYDERLQSLWVRDFGNFWWWTGDGPLSCTSRAKTLCQK